MLIVFLALWSVVLFFLSMYIISDIERLFQSNVTAINHSAIKSQKDRIRYSIELF